MTVTEHPEAEAEPPDRAAVFRGLSRYWQYPTQDLIRVLREASPGLSADVELRELRVEYTRLFLGPGTGQCPPYESVYRDGDDDGELGPVRGPSTDAVRRWYREFGTRPDPERPALADHVATELEFVAHLAETEDPDVVEQFLDEHPRRWVGTFAARVRDHDPDGFYRTLLDLTERAVETGGTTVTEVTEGE
ncbi:TorD/DmsD family molecular chaperone [Halostella litorea]|uniref:TorD/DmsD family molecular chaperone n=1 Tax=Halostella litorea TaxID=2528831 RepID=UPI0010923CA2|nr:molecular chaperone TorD family protein [Halostella litorea]